MNFRNYNYNHNTKFDKEFKLGLVQTSVIDGSLLSSNNNNND